MARICISSSWTNEHQPALVARLREQGHLVYDFRHCEGRNDRNIWESVTAELYMNTAYQQGILTPDDYDRLLSEQRVTDRFKEHLNALSDADTCVLLLPGGRSSHVEAGYMAGCGKRVFVYDTSVHVTPELMYLTFDGYFHYEEDLLKALKDPVSGICRVCGCTHHNPCYHPDHGYCFWVEPDLCSHCASKQEGGFGIKDDPKTKHCVNDLSNAFKY